MVGASIVILSHEVSLMEIKQSRITGLKDLSFQIHTTTMLALDFGIIMMKACFYREKSPSMMAQMS